ncbi:T9SS type A sorting domain-containing protein [bacterium]|nr:T9SS type A sorting domain-containing protein [bacterium]
MKRNTFYAWMNWTFYWTLFLIIVPVHTNRLNAQAANQINISFYYDATGNRTDRQIIIAMKATKPSDSLNNNMIQDTSSYLCASNKKDTEKNSYSSENKNDVYEDKIGSISLRLYPNPVHGSFNVIVQPGETATQQDQLKFFLYTTTGYLLQSGTIAFNENKLINMSEYIAGTYLFLVENKECRETWKIIKR